MTGFGDTETLLSFGVSTESVSVCATLLNRAVIVADLSVVTAVVDTVKVAVVAFAAMVTDAGTDALASELLNVTTMPPVGALLLSVTVPVDVVPPTTDFGERLTLTSEGELTFNVPVTEEPP